MLSDHIRAHPPGAEGFIFTSPSGRPINPGNFRRRIFDEAAKEAGIPWCTPNSLRHAGATLMRAAGGKLEEVSRRLGHSRTSLTADVYADVFAEVDEALTKGLEEIVSGARPATQEQTDVRSIPVRDSVLTSH